MRKSAASLFLLVFLSTAAVVSAQEQPPQDPSQQLAGPPTVGSEILSRALEEFQAQDYEQSVVDFSTFILLNPTYGRAYYFRAIGYQSLNETDAALADLSQALLYTEDIPDLQAAVYSARGDIYASEGNAEEALADYDEAVSLSQTSEIYTGRALFYFTQGDYEAAVSDFDEAINLATDNRPALYYYRAAAKTALRDDESAAADYFQWVNGIQQRTSEEDLLEDGESITLDFEPRLVYTIPFNAEPGTPVNIVAANVGGNADPLIVVVDEDGNPVIGNDDSGSNDTSAVIEGLTVPSEGTYTLYVTHSITGFTGRVIVLLETQQS
jgi:tetratricopeptide (TPR) repeat protein